MSSEIELNGNFKSKINFQKDIDKKQFIHKNFKYLKNITNFHADLSNSFLIKFDKTYKIMNYEYKNSGKIKRVSSNLINLLKIFFQIIKSISYLFLIVRLSLSLIQIRKLQILQENIA